MPFFDDPFLPDKEKETTETPDQSLSQEDPSAPTAEEAAIEAELAMQHKAKNAALVASIFDYVEIIAITFAAVLLATLFFFRHAIVDGDSMNGTLLNEEHLIISGTFYTPEAGDIIVFENNLFYGTEPMVKRIIATAGSMVEIRSSGIYVDGVLLEEPYAYLEGSPVGVTDYIEFMQRYSTKIPENIEGELVYRWEIEEGYVFVMGDNRFNSQDSRVFGPIEEESILGVVLFRFLPLDKFGGVD